MNLTKINTFFCLIFLPLVSFAGKEDLSSLLKAFHLGAITSFPELYGVDYSSVEKRSVPRLQDQVDALSLQVLPNELKMRVLDYLDFESALSLAAAYPPFHSLLLEQGHFKLLVSNALLRKILDHHPVTPSVLMQSLSQAQCMSSVSLSLKIDPSCTGAFRRGRIHATPDHSKVAMERLIETLSRAGVVIRHLDLNACSKLPSCLIDPIKKGSNIQLESLDLRGASRDLRNALMPTAQPSQILRQDCRIQADPEAARLTHQSRVTRVPAKKSPLNKYVL